MPLLCLLLLGLPAGPCVRWIDVKGDIHTDPVKEVLEETPSEVRVRLADGAERTVPVARILDLVRESEEREEERKLLDARRDVAAGILSGAARETLDRLARDGSQPWIREYAAAARAILAERAHEEDAGARLQRFLEEYPRSRLQSDCISAQARLSARARGSNFVKGLEDLGAARERIAELQGPLALRFRMLRDGVELFLPYQPEGFSEIFFEPAHDTFLAETSEGKDYGAYLLVEAEAKWGLLLAQQFRAADDKAHGRPPNGAFQEVKKLIERAGMDLPEVRSDLEREMGSLMLACGDKEGARGAWERARDLAPDPRRREAAEEALRKLAP